jgi:TldD protein
MQQNPPTNTEPLGQNFEAANATLLAPASLDTSHLQSVLSGMMSHDIDYADLYFQYSRSESWGLEEGQVKSGNFSFDQGVGVRAVSGEKTAFAYSDDITLPALIEAAKATKSIANSGVEQTATSQMIQREMPALYLPNDPIASLSAEAKVKLLERLEQFAHALDSRITQVTASIAGEYEVVMIARHDGVMAADVRPLVRLGVNVIAESQGRREQGSAGGGGRFDYSYFTDDVLKDYAKKAVHQAIVNLDARPAPAGSRHGHAGRRRRRRYQRPGLSHTTAPQRRMVRMPLHPPRLALAAEDSSTSSMLWAGIS